MEVNPTEPSPSVRVPCVGVSQAVVYLRILLKTANTWNVIGQLCQMAFCKMLPMFPTFILVRTTYFVSSKFYCQ